MLEPAAWAQILALPIGSCVTAGNYLTSLSLCFIVSMEVTTGFLMGLWL